MPNDNHDFSLANAVLRLGLGANLFTHGCVRLPALAGFVDHVEQMMAKSWLPLWLVPAAGHAIPFVELVTDALLILGLFRRLALILGSLLMIVLTVGRLPGAELDGRGGATDLDARPRRTLAGARYDRYSIGAWRGREARSR